MSGAQINTILRIDSVYAAVSVDDDGTEGLCAIFRDGHWLPLLAADEGRLPFIVEQAIEIARRDNRLVRIIQLTSRREIDTIDFRN